MSDGMLRDRQEENVIDPLGSRASLDADSRVQTSSNRIIQWNIEPRDRLLEESQNGCGCGCE